MKIKKLVSLLKNKNEIIFMKHTEKKYMIIFIKQRINDFYWNY